MNPLARRPRLFVAAALLWQMPLQAETLTVLDTPTGSRSLAPRLASLEPDRALLSWLDVVDGGHRLMLAEFDGAGFGPAREITRGDDFFANWADTPGLRVGHDGQWLAHWLVRSGRGTYAYDVVMALSSDGGERWSPPFSPHDDGTLTEHGFVSTFQLPSAGSGLGAVWLDGRETEPAAEDRHHDHSDDHHHGSGAMTLRAAIVRADGRIDQPALLDARVCDCCPTDAATTRDGAVVVYRDRSEAEIRDIALIRRDASGWADPIIVHSDGWRISGCPVNGPAVLAREQTVVVAWFTEADDRARVQIAWSQDGGRHFDPPLVLDEGTALGRVDLAWVGKDAVLSWLSETDDDAILRIARFEAPGRLREQRDLRRLDRGRISGIPRLLGLPDSRLLLTWTESFGAPPRPRVQAGLVDFEAGPQGLSARAGESTPSR